MYTMKDELLAADTVITHSRASAESLMKTADIGNKLDVWVTPWRIPGFLTGMEEPVSQDHEVPTVLVIGNLSEKVENEVYDALTKGSRSVTLKLAKLHGPISRRPMKLFRTYRLA